MTASPMAQRLAAIEAELAAQRNDQTHAQERLEDLLATGDVDAAEALRQSMAAETARIAVLEETLRGVKRRRLLERRTELRQAIDDRQLEYEAAESEMRTQILKMNDAIEAITALDKTRQHSIVMRNNLLSAVNSAQFNLQRFEADAGISLQRAEQTTNQHDTAAARYTPDAVGSRLGGAMHLREVESDNSLVIKELKS